MSFFNVFLLLGHHSESKQSVKVTLYFSPGQIKPILYIRGKAEDKLNTREM